MKHNVKIGKYTLESLTNGMYSTPKDLYREYIQNAVDSIDIAIDKGIIKNDNAFIDININREKKTITISDNGYGVMRKKASKVLLDIGNSDKKKENNRGFRGIGRLAGLGYCKTLKFTTSALGEDVKTVVVFDAELLRDLLTLKNDDCSTVSEVLNRVVKLDYFPEKTDTHYFQVVLEEVSNIDNLINDAEIMKYLVQVAPLPFDDQFKWKGIINNKVSIKGYNIPSYKIFLTTDGLRKELRKPYLDLFISDRIKKIDDNIKDIEIEVFSIDGGKVSAILWYALTNFNGTITDDCIKGIRIRQGNILIGGKSTFNQFFKEERFNGWIIGELHIIDDRLIPNSRRDNFEKNESYQVLTEMIREWTQRISKEIRKLAYKRSLSAEKSNIIEKFDQENIDYLEIEDMNFTYEDEITVNEEGDSYFLAQNDFIDKLNILLNRKNTQTKYAALNINTKLTIEQRKVLERVFDIITKEYSNKKSEDFISLIASKF